MVPSLRALAEGCLIMAKLLITLDGVQVGERDVDKERISIGRRAHNDIVLDNIGVSGEHAVVVTILNDSFLEDMGSTNGTVVNGAAVRKHFLRNGDLIEIGRHRMRFVGETAGTREAADFEKTMVLNRPTASPRPPATGDVRTATLSGWQVPEHANPAPVVAPALAASAEAMAEHAAPVAQPAHSHATAAEAVDAALAALEAESGLAAGAHAVAAPSSNPGAVAGAAGAFLFPALPPDAIADLGAQTAVAPAAVAAGFAPRQAPAGPALPSDEGAPEATPTPEQPEDGTERPPEGPAALAPLPRAHGEPMSASDAPAAVVAPPGRSAESPARLQVLNGSAAGRILEISKPLTTIGRPAVQVAVISRRSDGYYLAQVDGEQPARLNGRPLVPHAVALHAHDVLEIAGVKLEFFLQG